MAAVQHDIVWEDPKATTTALADPVAQAAGGGARLVVLSEMFATGFSMAPERIAEPEDGFIATWMREQAAANRCWVLGSIAQTASGGNVGHDKPANVAVLAGPDGEVHRYAKIHPFSYGGEDEHYRAGDRTLTVDVEGTRVSVFVCYDLRFPDVFYAVADQTDLYVVPANWPAVRQEPWRALLRARAIENMAYVVGVNRVGTAPGAKRDVAYGGASVIVDPVGTRLVEARDVATTLVAEVDPAVVAAARERFGFLADRTTAWTTTPPA
ncbi:nitrilase-related carbon-nitrogen hydrolase [Jatrophihabitans sp. YIM 134969]